MSFENGSPIGGMGQRSKLTSPNLVNTSITGVIMLKAIGFWWVREGLIPMFFGFSRTRDKDTLRRLIQKCILPGTRIGSDSGLRINEILNLFTIYAYDCLDSEEFIQFKVNHSITFKYAKSGVHSNTDEGMCRVAAYPTLAPRI